MAKNFDLEIRETFGKEYVKVFLKDLGRVSEVQALLANLPSVRKANIAKSSRAAIPS